MGVIFKVKFTLNIVCLFTVRIFSSQDLFIFGNIFFSYIPRVRLLDVWCGRHEMTP
jgi:hypothetical protein